MKELIDVRQIPGESRRRWFSSKDFDLIVWFSDEGYFRGFELCYDKCGYERSIRWTSSGGFHHMAVDDGERHLGQYKETPILILNGLFDASQVCADFSEVSHMLPREIAEYVLSTLGRYPNAFADYSV